MKEPQFISQHIALFFFIYISNEEVYHGRVRKPLHCRVVLPSRVIIDICKRSSATTESFHALPGRLCVTCSPSSFTLKWRWRERCLSHCLPRCVGSAGGVVWCGVCWSDGGVQEVCVVLCCVLECTHSMVCGDVVVWNDVEAWRVVYWSDVLHV